MSSRHDDPRLSFTLTFILTLFFCLIPIAHSHVAAWHKGMYCLNGTISNVDNQNTNDAVNPLWMLNKTDWWMHHINLCDLFPPSPGDFLELPAGGSFVVELAVNRAFTTLSYGGSLVTDFGDGKAHVGLGVTDEGKSGTEGCIVDPNIHTQNESMAAGTAFGISYTSDIKGVSAENLVIFTVLYNTPWKRIATYQVPNLPACPTGGCHCAWGWVPNGCGEPNMYMQPFRCLVTGQTGSSTIAPAVPPVWCEDNPKNCIKGPKQMVYWNQLEASNVVVSGFDLSGRARSPAYNAKMGFPNGAQTDIFLEPGTAVPTFVNPSSPSTSTSTTSVKSNSRHRMDIMTFTALATNTVLIVGMLHLTTIVGIS